MFLVVVIEGDSECVRVTFYKQVNNSSIKAEGPEAMEVVG